MEITRKLVRTNSLSWNFTSDKNTPRDQNQVSSIKVRRVSSTYATLAKYIVAPMRTSQKNPKENMGK